MYVSYRQQCATGDERDVKVAQAARERCHLRRPLQVDGSSVLSHKDRGQPEHVEIDRGRLLSELGRVVDAGCQTIARMRENQFK